MRRHIFAPATIPILLSPIPLLACSPGTIFDHAPGEPAHESTGNGTTEASSGSADSGDSADTSSTDSGEQDTGSDGGSAVASTGSSTTGQGPSVCGDGIVGPGESCDDGDLDETDDCLSTCVPAACGDGEVQAGVEECEPGVDPRCTETCGKERIVFVSSTAYVGSVLHSDQSDSECTWLANNAAVAGALPTPPGAIYRAWLSSPTRDVTDYVRPNPGRYVNTKLEVVAESWDDLVSGEVVVPIRYDEYGEEFIDYVWTGTDVGGGPASDHCESWTSQDWEGRAQVGFSGLAGPDWTDLSWPQDNPSSCAQSWSIYCIEQ